MQHPLPAPVVHAGFSVSQSKSHVLAGVQDAYWSDDDAVSFTLLHMKDNRNFHSGRRRMPPLSRGNGHLRSELQALCLWLSGMLKSNNYYLKLMSLRFVVSAGTISKRI